MKFKSFFGKKPVAVEPSLGAGYGGTGLFTESPPKSLAESTEDQHPAIEIVDVEIKASVHDADIESNPAPAKKLKFSFKRQKKEPVEFVDEATLVETDTLKPAKRSSSKATAAKSFRAIPVKVIMGYLPEVSDRDAREYAQGLAEKHFDQKGMVYFGAVPYDRGFCYEVHEGGEGKAYLPLIQKYFQSLGPFRQGEPASVVLLTATRKIEVLRLRDGIAALILPEGSDKEVTDWLIPVKALTSAMNRQKPFLYGGFLLFITGMIAMLSTAVFFRLQGYAAPPVQQTELIQVNNLPRGQWNNILRVPPGSYVKALRFEKNKWEPVETETPAAEVAPPPSPVAGPLTAPASPAAAANTRPLRN